MAGKRTIGYGHLCGPTEHYPHGITKEQAHDIFINDVKIAARHVQELLPGVTLNDNQLTALISLTFNCGSAPLKQTLGKLLRQPEPNYLAASDVILWWCKAEHPTTKKLRVVVGLRNRRARERALFLQPGPTILKTKE